MLSFSSDVKNYKGSIQGKICAICKLYFQENQEILQCKKCSSIFHQEHLQSWIEINDECPVCHQVLVCIPQKSDNNQMESSDKSMEYADRIKANKVWKNWKVSREAIVGLLVISLIIIILILVFNLLM